MKATLLMAVSLLLLSSCNFNNKNMITVSNDPFIPFKPSVSYEVASARADSIVKSMSIDERIEMIGGHNSFFVQGVEKANLPRLYLSDATQGVHLRKNLDSQLEKSVAMPCPIALTATWNRKLSYNYAKSIGEECRAGGISVLLGPGMNIYRISQNGRNFEYFGEDPFLASRMVENYIAGVQSTGTIATLKHFLCNNTDHRRRTSNSIVSERAIHEIYLPAFKAGVDAGAMAVMTSYNKINGEYASQNKETVSRILRQELGFKWLVMSDWWSVWEPAKAMTSGLDLDMPGDGDLSWFMFKKYGNSFLRANAKQLLKDGKVSEDDINRMASHIIATELAMQLDKRPVKDISFLSNFPKHEEIALQTAREGIVLLRNEEDLLPIKSPDTKILATGAFMKERMSGGGSADVEGYNWITMLDGLKERFGNQVTYSENPSKNEIDDADVIIISVGTKDSEGWDKDFNLPDSVNNRIAEIASINSNVVVVVNSGGGINMSTWHKKVSAILYCWYPGQLGNKALAEIIAGDINPSGKLPITIEKKFKESPGYGYIPKGESVEGDWDIDADMNLPVYDINYHEGVFVGYRWYDSKNIKPLYHFGFGLSYTTFDYSNLILSSSSLKGNDTLKVHFILENTGDMEGAEVAQLYIGDDHSSVERPVKELKDFIKVNLKPGERVKVEMKITRDDLSYYDEKTASWKAEPGKFRVMIGSSSKEILLQDEFELKE